MFNKPGVFNRNEPNAVPGRDGRPVLSGTPSAPAPTGPQPITNKNGVTAGSPPPAAKDAPAPKTPAPAGESHDHDAGEHDVGARLIVGPDVKLRGAEILDCDTLVVEGRVEATMDSRVIRIAEIRGAFEGELTVRSQLTIHSTGQVKGKVRYGKLIIEEGGELCGEISALGDSNEHENRPRIEPLPRTAAG